MNPFAILLKEIQGTNSSILALITKLPFKYLTLIFHRDSIDINEFDMNLRNAVLYVQF